MKEIPIVSEGNESRPVFIFTDPSDISILKRMGELRQGISMAKTALNMIRRELGAYRKMFHNSPLDQVNYTWCTREIRNLEDTELLLTTKTIEVFIELDSLEKKWATNLRNPKNRPE